MSAVHQRAPSVPIFHYGGVELDLDWVISYARVSSPSQTVEQGGGGIDRQIDEFHAFRTEVGVNEYTGLGSLVDDGKSGSTGKNIATGALGLFLDRIKSLPPKSGLVVESFSRLNRLPIDEALGVFLDICCENNVPLITLQDRRVYTKKSFRHDKGMVHQISSAMHSARDHSENISYYSKKSWRSRRGSITNNRPAWIIRVDGVLVLDEAKVHIIVRIFKMALTMGVDMIARTLNAENVPTLNARKRERGEAVWLQASILKLLRGRQVLGLQPVGHYVDGKRVVAPGEYTEAYPAAIDKALWDMVQAKLDERNSGGVSTGRNVTHYVNLLGGLARCVCGARMKVHSRQKGRYTYFGCSNAFVNKCEHVKYHRVADVERDLLAMIGNLTWKSDAPNDKLDDLTAQLNVAEKDAAKLQRNIDAMAASFADAPPSIRAAVKTLAQQHTDKLAVVTKLERQVATLQNAKPLDQELAAVQSLSVRLERLSGSALTEARAQIAMALPTLFRTITFAADGIVLIVNAKDGLPLA